jgi:hypothetical protein
MGTFYGGSFFGCIVETGKALIIFINLKLLCMEKINFSIDINAPKEKVWNVLWNDESYRKWTSPFAEGSYAKTDNWKEGSKVLFLGPDGGGGMVSKVASNKKNEFMSFEHLGVVKDGIEDTESDSAKGWAGARKIID